MKTIGLRVDDDLFEVLERQAQAQERSINKHVVFLLKQIVSLHETTDSAAMESTRLPVCEHSTP